MMILYFMRLLLQALATYEFSVIFFRGVILLKDDDDWRAMRKVKGSIKISLEELAHILSVWSYIQLAEKRGQTVGY